MRFTNTSTLSASERMLEIMNRTESLLPAPYSLISNIISEADNVDVFVNRMHVAHGLRRCV